MIIEENRSPFKSFLSVQTPFNQSRLTDLIDTWQEKTDSLTEKNRVVERRWTGFDRERVNFCQKWSNLGFGWFFERVRQAKRAENRRKMVKRGMTMWGCRGYKLATSNCSRHVWTSRVYGRCDLQICTEYAGSCLSNPTRSTQRWQSDKKCTPDLQQGCRRQVNHELSITDWVTSKNNNEPQSDVARHPEIPSQHWRRPDPFLSNTFDPSHSSSTDVLARRLIGTCA